MNPPFDETPQGEKQQKIFICTFAMIAKLASVDGKISSMELKAVEDFIERELHLAPERKRYGIFILNQSLKSQRSFKEYAQDYRDTLADKPQLFDWMFSKLVAFSCADQVLGPDEEKLLLEAKEIFDISDSRYEELTTSALPAMENDPYKILGCTPFQSFEEIKVKYAELCTQYDPAKIIELGLAEDFVLLAQNKYQVIQTAFIQVRKHKKEK